MPTLIGNIYMSKGDRVTVAYVEGQEGNVTLVLETSDSLWQSRARSIEAGWSRMPPSTSWVSHQSYQEAYRRVIEEGLPPDLIPAPATNRSIS